MSWLLSTSTQRFFIRANWAPDMSATTLANLALEGLLGLTGCRVGQSPDAGSYTRIDAVGYTCTKANAARAAHCCAQASAHVVSVA
ncbi:hypothetical protein AJ88_24260 [Mesorhizobium amorphae CCBAU 01583]|nr:hypothetical protein AJ88_24260 [Mesorhizobium amorphae CCBAU 01583]